MSSEQKKEQTAIAIIDEQTIRDKIYVIRGQQVMLDFELAEIYGYTTKAFNQQVKNNIEKFDEDFRFRLTREEVDNLVRSKNFTSRESTLFKGQSGGSRYLPWCFTEPGLYMLMTVLKGDLATQQSKALIRIFKGMKDYIISQLRLPALDAAAIIELQLEQHANDIREIRETLKDVVTRDELAKFMNSFTLPERNLEYVIYAGRTCEADAAYSEIYATATKTLYIVDNYIGPKTLLLLKSVPAGVKTVLFSDNVGNVLRRSELQTFLSEYPHIDLTIKTTGGHYHDRYIIVDHGEPAETIYHCGGSSKDAGYRITSITRADNNALYQPMIRELLSHPTLRFLW